MSPKRATSIGREKMVDDMSATSGTPAGIVSFYDGSLKLGTASPNDGVATFQATSLTSGVHLLTAVESGTVSWNDVVHEPRHTYLLNWHATPTPLEIRCLHAELLPLLGRTVEVARTPPPQRAILFQDMVTENQTFSMLSLFLINLPGLEQRVSTCDAQLRCAVAALAVERYRCLQGCWPSSLQQLTPTFLNETPIDPATLVNHFADPDPDMGPRQQWLFRLTKELQPGEVARLFQQPDLPAHRHYEVCRAYFHESTPAEQIARRFYLHVATVRAIARDFARARSLGPSDVQMRMRAITDVRQGTDPGTAWSIQNTNIGTVGGS